MISKKFFDYLPNINVILYNKKYTDLLELLRKILMI